MFSQLDTDSQFTNQSIIFIDTSIEGYQNIIDSVSQENQIVLLNEPELELSHISEQLANYAPNSISSLHIVTHGSIGNLHLGNNIINSDELIAHQQELNGWDHYLTDGADILLYGCNIAQGIEGENFIATLSQLTGADVAASEDLTGNEALEADWQLENSTGAIEAQMPFDPEALAEFVGTLLPAGFQNELVLEGVTQPIALENLPDGSMIIAFREGEIQRFDPSSSQPILENYLTVNNTFKAKETGLMDIRFDETEGYLYTYYSSAVTDRATISRWNMNNANPTEEIIWEDATPLNGTVFHIGGSIDFGPDGKIWLTIGDKFQQSTSPLLNLHNGKIVRINKDGSIPDGTDGWAANPYAIDSDPNTLADIWASGLRNPFRSRWDLQSGRFFIGDVGGNDNTGTDASWEELNIATLQDITNLPQGVGVSYGWPNYEGPATANDPTPSANYKDPFFSWQHDESGSAIIGGLVYRGTMFPQEYQGAYFFSNYVDETIRYLTFDQNGDVIGGDTFFNTASGGSGLGNNFLFDSDVGAVSEFEVGNDGALYYLDLSRRGDSGGNGTVRRITYIGVGNSAPEITDFSATPTNGPDPLTVDFSVTANDPDGDTLTYQWDLDGDPTTGNSFAGVSGLWEDVTTTGSTTYTYNSVGTYNPVVFVSDGDLSDRSDDDFPTPIQVGTPPTVSITSPLDGTSFQAGEIINLTAVATDAEDGNLTGTSVVWDTVLFHNDHNHPDPAAFTGIGPSFQIETSGHDYFGDVSWVVTVTATDSDGLTATDSITLVPDESILTLGSLVTNNGNVLPGADNPIKLDGLPLVEDAFAYDNVIGFENTLEAETDVIRNNTRYQFTGWSDGVTSATRNYFIPQTDTTLTANYALVNFLPDAMDDDYTIPEGSGSVNLDVLANDSDQEPAPLNLDSFTQPSNGTVTRDDKGTVGDTTDDELVYTPNNGFVGVDTFTYTVQDGFGDTDTATVSIQVGDPPTIAPVRNGLVLELDAGRGVTTNGNTVTAWTDQSGSGNDLTSSGNPQLATNALNGQSVIQFDTNGDKLTRSLDNLSNLPADDSERTVFMVAKYNENGSGGFGYGKTSQNDAFGLNVDKEGELLVQGWGTADMPTNVLGTGQGWLTQSAIVTTNPSGSSAEVVNHYKDGVLIDSQERNYTTELQTLVVGSNLKGRNSIDMEVAEILVYDRALSEVERQQIENYLQQKYGIGSGNPVNQPPNAVTDDYTVSENSTGNVFDVLANDSDPEGGAISLDSFTQPTNGTVTLDDNGTPADTTDDQLIYQPTANTTGTDSFTYEISDPAGNSVTGTVNITVTNNPSNNSPVAVDDALVVDEDSGANSLDVLVNDTDADIDSTTGAMDFTNYQVLTASQTSLRTITFRHLVNGGGLDTTPFVFDASPAGGDDPHFHMMGGTMQQTYLTQHNSGGNGAQIGFTFSREDGQAFSFQSFSYTSGIFFPGTNAEFTVIGTLASGGTISQTFPSATTEQVFQAAILDGAGWRNVTAVNFVGSLTTAGTEPTQELNIDDLVIGAAVPLTITDVGTASNGSVSIIDNEVVYTPDADFFGNDSFTYAVSDGSASDTATVNVTVNGTPDNPVAVDDSFNVNVNTDLTFSVADLLGNDIEVDGETLSLASIGQPVQGTLVDNLDGTYTYTSSLNFEGADTLTYSISDGNNVSTPATITINVGTSSLPNNGLVLHLDANQGVTTNGNTVTAWADQSGSGNDLTASGDPQLATNALNGQSVIQFDTNGDKLSRSLDNLSNLPSGDSERTVFMVAKYNENGSGGFGYGKTSQNDAFGLNVDAEGELLVQGWGTADMPTNVLGTGQGWLTQSAIVTTNPSGSSAEVVNHYKDGVLIDSQERNYTTELQTLVVGSNLKGRNSIDMEVAEILVYDRALSEAERIQVENYLKQKYGL